MPRSPGPATTWQAARARIGGFSSRPNRPPDDPEVVEAYRQLKYLRFRERVEEVLAAEPRLTEQQRRELAELLLTAGAR